MHDKPLLKVVLKTVWVPIRAQWLYLGSANDTCGFVAMRNSVESHQLSSAQDYRQTHVSTARTVPSQGQIETPSHLVFQWKLVVCSRNTESFPGMIELFNVIQIFAPERRCVESLASGGI